MPPKGEEEPKMQQKNYQQEILALIHSGLPQAELAEKLSDYHENDLADALAALTPDERQKLYAVLGVDTVAEIFSYLDDAAIADDVLVLDAFVLAASALVVAHRAEDLLAEETAWLGLEGAVVDGLRVLDLALGPFADGIGRGDRDGNAVERILFQADGGASLFAGDGATGFVGLDAHA
jgi:hypothetical protein